MGGYSAVRKAAELQVLSADHGLRAKVKVWVYLGNLWVGSGQAHLGWASESRRHLLPGEPFLAPSAGTLAPEWERRTVFYRVGKETGESVMGLNSRDGAPSLTVHWERANRNCGGGMNGQAEIQ